MAPTQVYPSCNHARLPGMVRSQVPAPLFVDPHEGGGADPAVVWDPATRHWVMFYTAYRSDLPDDGSDRWYHGTPLRRAVSADGLLWLADGQVVVPDAGPAQTWWAPDVIACPGGWCLAVTVLPGQGGQGGSEPAEVRLYLSNDLRVWRAAGRLPTFAHRLLDACLIAVPEGGWYALAKLDTAAGPRLAACSSPDLVVWTWLGELTGLRGGDGPDVFAFAGSWWLLVDIGAGNAVYRAAHPHGPWTPAGSILGQPGTRPGDDWRAGQVEVVVSGGRAFAIYHVLQRGARWGRPDGRTLAFQLAELFVVDGHLICDRDAPPQLTSLPVG